MDSKKYDSSTNNRWYFICMILLCLVVFSSCGKESFPDVDSYVAGEDFQYFQTSEQQKIPNVQESDQGCYLYHSGFVYSYSRETNSIKPLCAKPNCLHDQETDSERLSRCNAYLNGQEEPDDTAEVSQMAYKNSVYICYQNSDPEKQDPVYYTLYRIDGDGSSKELVFGTHENVITPLIHRGYLYYLSRKIELSSTSISDEYCVKRLNITKKNAKTETIFGPFKEVFGYGYLQAFGNNVLFELDYKNEGVSMVLQKYDIQKKEIMETVISGHPTWYAEKFYETDFVYGEDDQYPTSIYQMDMSGTNREDALSGVPNGSLLMADGKYLYRNNAWVYFSFPEVDFHYWVYDQNLNLIDEFSRPETDTSMLGAPIGGSEYQYMVFDDEESGQWGLYIWDKSSIGSLKGSPYKQEKIIYGVK